MKHIALSLFVIASSGAYVWEQAGTGAAGDAGAVEENVLQPPQQPPAPAPAFAPSAPPLPARQPQSLRVELPPAILPSTVITKTAVAIATPASEPRANAPADWTPAKLVADDSNSASSAIKPVAYIPIPKPKPAHRLTPPPRLIKVGASTLKTAAGGFADGTYTGPVTDAYYGLIQIQALIKGGRLTALKVLKYPSDRRTSIYINRQALPLLRDEAIRAQSAHVDIISGATLTSRAFIQSLGGALQKAST